MHTAQKLDLCRTHMRHHGFDGWLVVRSNAFLQEFLRPEDELVRWLTGFSGSAAEVVLTSDQAVVFVDSRYDLQAARELDPALFQIVKIADMSPLTWCLKNLPPKARLGIDGTSLSVQKFEALHKRADTLELVIEPCDGVRACLEAQWRSEGDLPVGSHDPLSAFRQIAPEFIGHQPQDILDEIRADLLAQGCDAMVFCEPQAINWLFGIRGGDVPMTPLVLMRMIVTQTCVQVFVEHLSKRSAALTAFFQGLDIDVFDGTQFFDALSSYISRAAVVAFDPAEVPVFILKDVPSAQRQCVPSPLKARKACKSVPEINGMREAHAREVPVFQALEAWLDARIRADDLPDECAVADKIDALRSEHGALSLSFETIAGFGGNGAIVHYRAQPSSCARLERGGLLLLDSGGQYPTGTTDITRVYAIGHAGDDMRAAYRAVYDGYCAAAHALFPYGTTGAQIDALARAPLWALGFDYGHGTGHGVGACLGVHESPPSLSKRGTDPIEAGMIVSIEPGVYLEGRFGIRLENLAVVVERGLMSDGVTPLLGFEVLTQVPLAPDLPVLGS